MAKAHTHLHPRIDAFDLKPGRIIAGKYRIESALGRGWEGEVYKVVERKTGINRAAKLLYPKRNANDRAVHAYATKLDRLRKCAVVIQYHSAETIRFHGVPITCLISELVEGELLRDFIRRQPGQRLRPFEALHLLYALVSGVEQIHKAKEYHGDLHDGNILVERMGIRFDVRVVDFYHWGPPTRPRMQEDVIEVVRILYDSVGGARWYARQPPAIKSICRGLRHDLICRRFPTARHLREHLESFTWEDG